MRKAVPVVQNEERVMCDDKLFLTESFIQSRFFYSKDDVFEQGNKKQQDLTPKKGRSGREQGRANFAYLSVL